MFVSLYVCMYVCRLAGFTLVGREKSFLDSGSMKQATRNGTISFLAIAIAITTVMYFFQVYTLGVLFLQQKYFVMLESFFLWMDGRMIDRTREGKWANIQHRTHDAIPSSASTETN